MTQKWTGEQKHFIVVLYSPNGVSLEAVGAPGEELPDAVQVAAARGQMQRRAPGESAGARAQVKYMTKFPQKARFFFPLFFT